METMVTFVQTLERGEVKFNLKALPATQESDYIQYELYVKEDDLTTFIDTVYLLKILLIMLA